MGILAYISSKAKSSGFVLLLMMLFCYFTYFAFRGDRGFFKYMYLQEKVAEGEKLQQEYDMQKDELEKKVKLLSSNSLDLDLLDERARAVLNVVADDEFIILDEE